MGKLQEKWLSHRRHSRYRPRLAKLFASEGAHVVLRAGVRKNLSGGGLDRQQRHGSATFFRSGRHSTVSTRKPSEWPNGHPLRHVGLVGLFPLEHHRGRLRQTFDTNVKGLLFTVQKALPLPDRRGFHHSYRIARLPRHAQLWRFTPRQAAVRSFVREPGPSEFKGTPDSLERSHPVPSSRRSRPTTAGSDCSNLCPTVPWDACRAL